jgi:CubicO group peptidase (beta-lactamase class C family)
MQFNTKKIKKMKTILPFLLLFITTFTFGQTKKDSLNQKLDEYFTALTNLKNFNGNVIIAQKGKILLDKTYNMAGETDSLRVSKKSKFIIASVSKVFIKFGILKLAEQNKLQLTDKLAKFVPDFPNGEKITIAHLLHHQSGLPREITDKEAYQNLPVIKLSKIIDLAKAEKLQFEPGSQVFYSNIGYFLLHYIIDKTSKNGYLAFMQKEIFDKMKLNNTSEFNASKEVQQFAFGFDNEEGKLVATSLKNINQTETGNYLSTIDDLYRFSQQMLAGKVLKKSFALKMFEPDSVFSQTGGRSGYRSYFYKNLKTDVTFIFVSNYTDMPLQEAITDIMCILNNKPYQVPQKINRKEIQLSNEILSKYVGKFALEADLNAVYSIELIGNQLFDVEKDGKKIALLPDTEYTFFQSPSTKDGYVFTLNPQTTTYDLTIIATGVKFKTKRLE